MEAIIYFFFLSFGVLRCQALNCSPVTDNTCTKSLFVTGKCVLGVCECVSGTHEDEFGCHKIPKPLISVKVRSGQGWIQQTRWNHEGREGYMKFQCDQATFFANSDGKLIRNGTIVGDSSNSELDVLVTPGTWEFYCSYRYKFFGWKRVQSDAVVVNIKSKEEPFTIKPLISGIPDKVPVGTVFKIYCNNIPSFNGSFVFNIDGQEVEETKPETKLHITADLFKKSVSCFLKSDTGIKGITSDPVRMPDAPSNDLPDVFIEQFSYYSMQGRFTLYLECSFRFKFEPDNVSFTWTGPNGMVIQGETSQIYEKRIAMKEDSGQYSCTVNYDKRITKVSPKIEVIIRETGTTYVESVPQKPVIGGHISFICKNRGDAVPGGFNPKYVWEGWLQHTDSVLQIDNITANDLGQNIFCGYQWTKFDEVDVMYVPAPLPMSNLIQPSVTAQSQSENSNHFTVTCKTEYNTPGTRFQWFVDDVQQDKETSNSFSFSQTGSNSVNVKCRLSFNYKLSEFSQACAIPGKGSVSTPVIKVDGSPKSFVAGASYLLHCSCLSQAGASYSWKKGDVNLNIHTSSLRLDDIGSDDNGKYSCIITLNGKSVESDPLEIVALGEIEAPVVEIVTSPHVDTYGVVRQLKPGSTYYLQCSSPAHYNAAQYSWKRVSYDLKVPDKIFRIYDASSDYDGLYICTIKVGDISKDSNPMAIRGKKFSSPRVIERDFLQYFIIGGDYSLICDSWLDQWSQNKVTYSWKRGNADLQITDKVLPLRNIQAKDSGNYSCNAIVGNRAVASGNSLSVVATNEGKYCTSDKACQGRGFFGSCVGRQCPCDNGYRIEGDKCDSISQGNRVNSITYTGFLLAMAVSCMRHLTHV